MIFITALCLALASGKQFMPLLESEDQGVSARNDLTEIEDVALTAPSSLQRLLSSDDKEGEADEDKTGEEEEDDTEEDKDEEDDEDNEDGEKGLMTPQVVGVGALVTGVGAFAIGHYLRPKEAARQRKVEVTEGEATKSFVDWLKKKNIDTTTGKTEEGVFTIIIDDTLALDYISEEGADNSLQELGITFTKVAPAAPTENGAEENADGEKNKKKAEDEKKAEDAKKKDNDEDAPVGA